MAARLPSITNWRTRTGQQQRNAPTPRPRARPRPRTPTRPRPPARDRPLISPRPKRAPKRDPYAALVDAALTQRYGDAERALAGERAVSEQVMRNIPAWFDDYRAALDAATKQTAGAYATAAQTQANVASSSSALDAQQRAALESAQAADAASRGATVDPQVAAQGQQAAAARRAMLDAYSGLTARQGATQTAYAASRGTVAAGQKLGALQAEAGRRRAVERDATGLARERGAFAVTERQRLTDEAHRRRLEDRAFGLDVAKAQSDEAAKAAALRDRRQARITSNRNADASRAVSQGHLTLAQRREQRMAEQARARAGQGRPRTASQRSLDRRTRDDIQYAQGRIRHLSHALVPKTRYDKEADKDVIVRDAQGRPVMVAANLTEQQIRAALRNGEGPNRAVPDAAISAAYDLIRRGYLSQRAVDALHQRGVSVLALGYQTQRSRPRARLNPTGRPNP